MLFVVIEIFLYGAYLHLSHMKVACLGLNFRLGLTSQNYLIQIVKSARRGETVNAIRALGGV